MPTKGRTIWYIEKRNTTEKKYKEMKASTKESKQHPNPCASKVDNLIYKRRFVLGYVACVHYLLPVLCIYSCGSEY